MFKRATPLILQLHREATTHLENGKTGRLVFQMFQMFRDLEGTLSHTVVRSMTYNCFANFNNVHQTKVHGHPALLLLNKTTYDKPGNMF